MSIKAESAHYFKDEDYFLLNDVTAVILSNDITYSVAAHNGRYEPKEKLVILTGEVRTADSSGRVLTSPRMDLDMSEGTFTSQDEFCMEDPGLNLMGRSFNYDTKTGLLEVEGRVFMLISQPSERPAESVVAEDLNQEELTPPEPKFHDLSSEQSIAEPAPADN
jgi:LPS export ABC transporter protein LptC